MKKQEAQARIKQLESELKTLTRDYAKLVRIYNALKSDMAILKARLSARQQKEFALDRIFNRVQEEK